MSEGVARASKEIALRHVSLLLCQACIDGVGQECHTPGCTLFLHRVDLPIAEELLDDVSKREAAVRREVWEEAATMAEAKASKFPITASECAYATACDGFAKHFRQQAQVPETGKDRR